MTLVALLAVPIALLAVGPSEDEWPGWRGPHGNGVGAGAPPTEWSEDANIRWKVPIPGKGLSSPVIWGERIFLTTAVPIGAAPAEPEPPADGGRGRFGGRGRRSAPIVEQEFLVLALDRSNGVVVWQETASKQVPHQGTHRDGSYASPTIATDGEHVIASFGSFGIYAYTFDGELVWQQDLGDMDVAGSFGEGSSPLLHGDTVVVNWDHNGDSFIVALDKRTGKERWRKQRDSATSWVTPMLIEGKGGAQVVVTSAKTIAYALDSGREVWSSGGSEAPPSGGAGEQPGEGGAPGGAPGGRGRGRGGRGGGGGGGSGGVASPVSFDGVLLYSTSSRRGEFRALRVAGAEGALDDDAVLWTSAGDTPYIPSPIAYDGILYSLKSNSGLLSAYDVQSGERLYGPERMSGLADAYASPVAAGGALYFAGRDGTVEVVAAGPEFYSISVNQLEGQFDASPAIAGDELFLRSSDHLYCLAAEQAVD